MKKINLLYAILVGLSLNVFQSCHGDLDFSPYGETPQTEFWKTPEDARSAVYACYGKLVDWPFFEPTTFGMQEITSDNTVKGSTSDDQPDINMFDTFTFTPAMASINTFWTSRYSAINVCNQAITNIPSIAMDETEKKQLLGEARFIRAWLYFEMEKTFGEVIVYDGLPQNNAYNIPKSSIDEVYKFIVSDLEYGIQNMRTQPWPDEWKGRVTSWTAKALLAKVKMYMASSANFTEDGHSILNTTWNDVKTLTDDVISNGPYRLLTSRGDDSFYYLFRLAYENSEESIFEAQCGASRTAGSINRSAFAVYQWIRGQNGWGFNIPSDELVATWKARSDDQIRFKASVIFRGQTLPDGDEVGGDTKLSGTNAGEPGADPARYNYKVYVPKNEATNLTWMYGSEQNPRLLRFADILLIDAEAEFRLGNIPAAVQSVNLVRDRVRETPLTTASVSLQKILDERRFELAFENDRFFDLVRSGQAKTVLANKGFQYPKHNFFPIPQQQVDLSGGVLTQNKNY